MTQTSVPVDLTAVKARQQQTWASGDFAVVASRIVLASEQLAESVDLHAGWTVLDVACGSGNAAIAAARSGTRSYGVDYVPALIETARDRAAAEGLAVVFDVGDAEALPYPDDSFDAALSVFGCMFAPDHHKAAAELCRVVRPHGRIGLVSWTPEGFIGEMFRLVSSYVAPPPGVAPPVLWGTQRHLEELFAGAVAGIDSVERTCVFRFESPEQFVEFFRRWYGPTLKAFQALPSEGQAALASDLAGLARRFSRRPHDPDVAIAATYLESVITLV